MKWIGQHIYDLISKFRNDVYLESVSTGTIASGGNLGLDSNNKIVKATIASGSGDITAVTITTDSGGGSAAEDADGSADFSLLGAAGVGITNSGTTITARAEPSEIDHDSLQNFDANEHFTQANITTVGTISTGVWQGTAIASAYLDSDTAHLSGAQTFTGSKTMGTNVKFNFRDGNSYINSPTANDLEIVATDIVLDAAAGISLEIADDENLDFKNGSNTFVRFNPESGASTDLFLYEMGGDSTDDYASINVAQHGATTIATHDDAATAAHFEIAADGDIILDSAGQIKLEPVAGNNILLDGTVTVDGGSVTGITTLGVDSVSLTAVQTSGESFADNDTSIMTSAAIDDKINTKYSHSTISFAGQASMLSSGNWVMPGKPGIGSHTWNNDMGVNTETNGSSTASIDRRWAHAGVRLPSACIIDGISCAISNASGNRQATVGLFFARASDGSTAPTWGTHSGNVSVEPILQIHADANNESGSYSGRPSHAEVTGSDIAMAAGDMFYPAIKLTGVTTGGNTDTVYASFSVHVKTLIS
tara:strand:+ start:159 stop:1766 length:1608 start_codon:yes stop_codon:yes gene_type:complete